MGYNKSLSAVYSDIWERYKHHCEREGMIALNRFCEGEGIRVQRLYEWLRRRRISISDDQESLSGMPAGVRNHEEALFREIRLPRPSHARGDAEAATADVVRDIRTTVRDSRYSLKNSRPDFGRLSFCGLPAVADGCTSQGSIFEIAGFDNADIPANYALLYENIIFGIVEQSTFLRQ